MGSPPKLHAEAPVPAESTGPIQGASAARIAPPGAYEDDAYGILYVEDGGAGGAALRYGDQTWPVVMNALDRHDVIVEMSGLQLALPMSVTSEGSEAIITLPLSLDPRVPARHFHRL